MSDSPARKSDETYSEQEAVKAHPTPRANPSQNNMSTHTPTRDGQGAIARLTHLSGQQHQGQDNSSKNQQPIHAHSQSYAIVDDNQLIEARCPQCIGYGQSDQ